MSYHIHIDITTHTKEEAVKLLERIVIAGHDRDWPPLEFKIVFDETQGGREYGKS